MDLTYPGPQLGDVSGQIVGRDILQKGILTNNPTKTAHFKTGRIATEDSISKNVEKGHKKLFHKIFPYTSQTKKKNLNLGLEQSIKSAHYKKNPWVPKDNL